MQCKILNSTLFFNGKNIRNTELSNEDMALLADLKLALLEELNCPDSQTYFITDDTVAIYNKGRVTSKEISGLSTNLDNLIKDFQDIMEQYL
jgi:hypothetical protein